MLTRVCQWSDACCSKICAVHSGVVESVSLAGLETGSG